MTNSYRGATRPKLRKPDFDADLAELKNSLRTLALNGDAFAVRCFRCGVLRLPQTEKHDTPEEAAEKCDTAMEAALKFGPDVPKKHAAMTLLRTGKWSTRDIRDALDCSEALISQARRELVRLKNAGVIAELPANVTNAHSAARCGTARPDVRAAMNAAWRAVKAADEGEGE